ncbi:hypothetical protein N7528_010047 [Penicillium herquei]|nr:hypothetical protein N7528_010047 [Penicillium herquei]
MDSFASEPVFTDEEVEFLESEQIFLPPQTAGKRKVSAAFTPPPSISTSSSSSRSSSASVTLELHGFDTRVTQFEIPTERDSTVMLELMGFQPATAALIFDRFITRPEADQSILSFAEAHLRTLQSHLQRGLGPKEAMNIIGINDYPQEALTDLEFEGIRGTEELHFWLRLAVRTSYKTIRMKQELLKSYAEKRHEHGQEHEQDAQISY